MLRGLGFGGYRGLVQSDSGRPGVSEMIRAVQAVPMINLNRVSLGFLCWACLACVRIRNHYGQASAWLGGLSQAFR